MADGFNHMRGIGGVRSEMCIMLDEQQKIQLIQASEILRQEARRFLKEHQGVEGSSNPKDKECGFRALEKYYELSKIAQSLETIAGVDSI